MRKNKLVKLLLSFVLIVSMFSMLSTGTASAAQAFIKPAEGSYTSYFGPRGSGYHYGVDIALSGTNVAVNASGTGVVRTAVGGCSNSGYIGSTCNYGRGNYMVVRHTFGGQTFDTLYEHLSAFSVSVGQNVSQGQRIGTMGNSGNSSGQHLHFEMHPGGFVNSSSAVNPMPYIDGTINPAPTYHTYDGTYASLRTKSLNGGDTINYYSHPGYGLAGTLPVGNQYKVYSRALGNDQKYYYAIAADTYVHEDNATVTQYKGTVKSGPTIYVYDAINGNAKQAISAGSTYTLIAAREGWYAIDSTNWFRASDLNVTK